MSERRRKTPREAEKVGSGGHDGAVFSSRSSTYCTVHLPRTETILCSISTIAAGSEQEEGEEAPGSRGFYLCQTVRSCRTALAATINQSINRSINPHPHTLTPTKPEHSHTCCSSSSTPFLQPGRGKKGWTQASLRWWTRRVRMSRRRRGRTRQGGRACI